MKIVQLIVYSLTLIFFIPSAFATNEVKCICNDRTVEIPKCGICGERLGSMEKTNTGAKCFCERNLYNQEISCEETCKDNKGWSGKFED